MKILKTLLLGILLLPLWSNAQISPEAIRLSENNSSSILLFEDYLKLEPFKSWSVNLTFSDNGFGAGVSYYKYINKDLSAFGSIHFSSAKDDREFEVTDIYGNSYVPNKVNRMYMIPVDLGLQFRLFREDVTDDLRPHISFGLSPTTVLYAPYNESVFSNFGHMRAKYTVGAFLGAGVDYLTGNKSSISANVRYYYINLFNKGIESLAGKQKTFFGGLYFNFSYNFMK